MRHHPLVLGRGHQVITDLVGIGKLDGHCARQLDRCRTLGIQRPGPAWAGGSGRGGAGHPPILAFRSTFAHAEGSLRPGPREIAGHQAGCVT